MIFILIFIVIIGWTPFLFELNRKRILKKKIESIKIGQVYELKMYADDPFERGKHTITIIDIREGYALYKTNGKYTSSDDLESIARRYVLIKDVDVEEDK